MDCREAKLTETFLLQNYVVGIDADCGLWPGYSSEIMLE